MSSSRPHSKWRPTDPEFWTVINELPDPIPVGKDELDAIERYFSDVLDEVLGPKKFGVGTSPPDSSGGRDNAG
jgi:hypothetical protein